MNNYFSKQASNTIKNIYHVNKKKTGHKPIHCDKCKSSKEFNQFGDYYYCINCGTIKT